MSNIGIFAKATTQAGADLMLAQLGADIDYATMNLEIVNTTGQDASLKVAITNAAQPGAGDYIEFGAAVPASGGVFSRSCFLVGPGEKIFINSSVAGLAVRLTGLTQPAS